MSNGINRVILIGNLGQDPEVRHMPNGNAVANVSIATSESWKDNSTGEKKERTEWHRVVFFGKLAEIVEKYLKKGSKVYVEGRLQTRKWQDKTGADRYTTETVVDMRGTMQMLGDKGCGNGRAEGYGTTQGQGQAKSHDASTGFQFGPAQAPHNDGGFDDDISF